MHLRGKKHSTSTNTVKIAALAHPLFDNELQHGSCELFGARRQREGSANGPNKPQHFTRWPAGASLKTLVHELEIFEHVLVLLLHCFHDLLPLRQLCSRPCGIAIDQDVATMSRSLNRTHQAGGCESIGGTVTHRHRVDNVPEDPNRKLAHTPRKLELKASLCDEEVSHNSVSCISSAFSRYSRGCSKCPTVVAHISRVYGVSNDSLHLDQIPRKRLRRS
mmetsp:Transcript_7706/g.20399  ORF Transcript_7706/g.20399 Transcript_7706/m.20399 type:complete len:220 (+) Transcript_7706:2216-2875(+)